MSVKQKFAQTVISTSKEHDNSTLPVRFLVGAFAGLLLGLPTAIIYDELERDDGNEHAEKIYQQYDTVLKSLEKKSQTYNNLYQSPLETNSEISNIKLAMTELTTVDSINDKQDKDWQKIEQLAGVFAKSFQTDDKLSEVDAERLAPRLDKIVSFENLGYMGMPDAGDLRECQADFSNAKDINKCSIETSPESKNIEFLFLAPALSLGLLFFSFPLVARGVERAQGNRLRRWAEGKSSKPNH